MANDLHYRSGRNSIVISRIKDNKIVEDRELLDNLTFFQQLDIVPEFS